MRWTLIFGVLAVALGMLAPNASACWDNTDQVIQSLKKLNLSTDQLKDVFVYQKEHRAVVARAHSEKLGCRYHENHHKVFQKQAIGVLTHAQFKKYTGRSRTKVESLEYENRLLKKEIKKLQEQLKRLQAQLEKRKK